MPPNIHVYSVRSTPNKNTGPTTPPGGALPHRSRKNIGEPVFFSADSPLKTAASTEQQMCPTNQRADTSRTRRHARRCPVSLSPPPSAGLTQIRVQACNMAARDDEKAFSLSASRRHPTRQREMASPPTHKHRAHKRRRTDEKRAGMTDRLADGERAAGLP